MRIAHLLASLHALLTSLCAPCARRPGPWACRGRADGAVSAGRRARRHHARPDHRLRHVPVRRGAAGRRRGRRRSRKTLRHCAAAGAAPWLAVCRHVHGGRRTALARQHARPRQRERPGAVARLATLGSRVFPVTFPMGMMRGGASAAMVRPRPAARAASRSLHPAGAGAGCGGGGAALARQHRSLRQAAHAVGRWRAWCAAQPGALLVVKRGRGPVAAGAVVLRFWSHMRVPTSSELVTCAWACRCVSLYRGTPCSQS